MQQDLKNVLVSSNIIAVTESRFFLRRYCRLTYSNAITGDWGESFCWGGRLTMEQWERKKAAVIIVLVLVLSGISVWLSRPSRLEEGVLADVSVLRCKPRRLRCT